MSSGELVNTYCWPPLPEVLIGSGRSGAELRICVSNEVPGDADAVGPGTRH